MKSELARLALFASLLVLLCSVLFIVNQTAQVVSLANTISPLLGKIVLVSLLLAFSIILLVPLGMIARMPAAIHPPVDIESDEYQAYLLRLGKRLTNNPHLAGIEVRLSDRSGIEAALKILDAKVDECIRATASSIFVSTAISQNGKLDGLMVLAAQSRMIWQISQMYNQRPSPREMIRLYGNVGVTVFAASAIEDLDIHDQVSPVISAAFSSLLASVPGDLLGSVPGMGHVSHSFAHLSSLLTESVLEGTTNAYLTLRVGVICRMYCASLVSVDRKLTRRYASFTAASMLGSIASGFTATVGKTIFDVGKKSGMSTVESTSSGIRKAGKWLNPFRRRPK